MAGKFINELSSNPPAPEDLVVFFDKSKAVTVQAPLSDVVGAGLNIAGATKGQTAVVDTKVDPISLETIPFLKWEKAGIDFGSTTTKPSAGTDEIITHDPVTGTNGKTTLAELIKSVLPPVTGADAGKQLTVDVNGAAGWTADTSDLPVFTLADAKKQLTVNDAGDAVIWKADPNEIPTPSLADAGKSLLVKADGTGPEWGSPFPVITDGKFALQTKADKSGVEWTSSVNMAANLKGGFTAGAFFPVNDTKADTTRFVDAPTYRRLVGVPEQLYFPNWTPTNDQIGAGWNDMGVALARMGAIAGSDPFAGTGAVTKSGTFPGNYGYSDAVLLSDGNVFVVPNRASQAMVYNTASGTASLVGSAGDFPTSGHAFGHGVLLSDGRVFIIPKETQQAKIYNPKTGAVSNAGASNAFPSGYSNPMCAGGVLLPNGKVFCVPANATQARVYDPVTDTVSLVGATNSFPGSGAYLGGVLLPNGKVFCVPNGATQARVYDPVTDTVSLVGATNSFPGSGAYQGGVLLPNGKVFCVPYGATQARVYDPVTDTVSLVGAANSFPGSGAYLGGVLLPNGKVFCVPYAATQAALADFSSISLGAISPNFYLSPYYNKSL
jgi:hypothetical protein